MYTTIDIYIHIYIYIYTHTYIHVYIFCVSACSQVREGFASSLRCQLTRALSLEVNLERLGQVSVCTGFRLCYALTLFVFCDYFLK
jgi:hypothetical protein